MKNFGTEVLLALLSIATSLSVASADPASQNSELITLSKKELRDKINGAWAAQMIGVTYGFRVEFRYNSTIVPDSHPLPWPEGYLKQTFDTYPMAYDDIYVDLTFVEVLEDEGLDAPAASFATAFATAEYPLWFANQVARHNLLHGLSAPESGHWLNNPSANDIDFQIEADFIGIMSPGMVNSAVEMADKVGHIMSYGDGWYGGVFVAALYSNAFVSSDLDFIIRDALKTIPAESQFHQVISDVIRLHEKEPDDWKKAWFEIHKKWADTDLGPAGVWSPFNIDAKINAAWVVLGLLYGDGDFERTMEIAARSGDDADCNPATAAGILGVINGYEALPSKFTRGLAAVKDRKFSHTSLSLQDAYDLSFKHALQMIQQNGGSIDDKSVIIKRQIPETTRLEVAFDGYYPKERRDLSYFATLSPVLELDGVRLDSTYSFEFEGVGFAVMRYVARGPSGAHDFKVNLGVDGEVVETATLPTDLSRRRFYLFWRYDLPDGKHTVDLETLNPAENTSVMLTGIVVYGQHPGKHNE